MKVKKSARVVLFDTDGGTPILNVRNGEYFKIPGGGIEKGENEKDAAKREALEEAGCVVEILGKIGEHEFIDPNPEYSTIHHSVCFLAKKIGRKKSPTFDAWEQSNKFTLMWVTFDEAVRLFESSVTDDKFGEEINKRDLTFLKKGKELHNKYSF